MTMSKEDIDKTIKEARGILTVPVIGDALKHKIKELMRRVAGQIDLYIPYATAILSLKDIEFEEEETAGHERGSLRFKLIRFSDNLWIPITSTSEVNPFMIVPEPVVDYVVKKSSKEPGILFMEKRLVFKELPGMVFDLSFEMTNGSLINGIIKEKSGQKFEEDSVDIDEFIYRGEVKLRKILEIIETMASDDEYYQHALREFQLYWQPMESRKSTASTG